MAYTSTNGTFTYTITNNTSYVFEPIDYIIIQSAFDRWDNIMTLDSRLGNDYTITVSFLVDTLDPGTLGGASNLTVSILDSLTYGNVFPYRADITMNATYLYEMKNSVRSDGKTSYYYVLLHEIGHILGIGTFWDLPETPKVSYIDNGVTKYYYTGVNALREYKSYFSAIGSDSFIGIPIEDDGGGGTANVHPEEGPEHSVSADNRYINGIFHPGLDDELMTGWLDSAPVPTQLSRVTLGFLEDMGYNVNYNLVDVYIMAWPETTDANNLDKAYIQGFLDVSGITILRGDTTLKNRVFIGNDVSINGFLRAKYPNESIPPTAIIGGVGSNTFAGDVYMDSNMTVTGDVSLNARLYVANDVSMNAKLRVSGATILNDTLSVLGAATLSNRFYQVNSQAEFVNTKVDFVNGDVTVMNGNLITSGNVILSKLQVSGATTIGGSTVLSGTLSVIGDVSMNQKLRVLGDVSLNGSRTDICGNLFAVYPNNSIPQAAIIGGVGSNNFTDDVSMNSKLRVGGDVSMNSKLQVSGATTLGGTLAVTGATNISGTLTAGSTSLSGTLAVTGSTTLGNALAVTGAATLANTLAVTGAATLANTLAVTGATTLANTLAVTGATTIYGTVYATNWASSTIPSAAIIGGVGSNNFTADVSMNSKLRVGGDVSMNSKLQVSGATTLGNTLAVTGATTLAGNLAVTGATTLAGNLGVTGATTITGTLTTGATTITGTLTTGATTITGTLNTGSITTSGTLNAGASTLSGDTTLNGTLAVTGATTLANTLAVTGATTIYGTVYATNWASSTIPSAAIIGGVGSNNFTADVSMNSKLRVGGDVSMNSKLQVSGATTLGNTLAVTGATTLAGNLAVTGATTLANTLAVTGAATIYGTVYATNWANNTIPSAAIIGGVGSNNFTADVSMNSKLRVGGDVSMNSALQVIGATTLGNTLAVTGASTFTGAATLASTLAVTGAAIFYSTIKQW